MLSGCNGSKGSLPLSESLSSQPWVYGLTCLPSQPDHPFEVPAVLRQPGAAAFSSKHSLMACAKSDFRSIRWQQYNIQPNGLLRE